MAGPLVLSIKDAQQAGLNYVTDLDSGIERTRRGQGFVFRMPNGDRVGDKEVLARIRSLAIPPAWTRVWISLDPAGHLQATGRDAKGRKQAIYHADWRSHRDAQKFERLKAFGEALPEIRAQVDEDLHARGLSKSRVVAAVVRLLESTLIRIGNPEYAKQNRSYGLTTMRVNHVELGRERLRFTFRGKSGRNHEVSHRDRRIAHLVRQVQDLPGQALFQYVDSDGKPVEIRSNDVNDYLRAASGADFTAKEFRTWAATTGALRELRDLSLAREGPLTAHDLALIVKAVSLRLGNTPAVCRSSYIHPAVFTVAKEAPWLRAPLPRRTRWLDRIERLTLEKLLA